MAFDILSYKADKGRYTRSTAFGLLVGLLYYGATTLRDFLYWEWATKELGFTIPVLNIVVTPGFLIATAVFVAGFLGLRYLVNQPRPADLLIDTEEELKRVTWPSWPETLNGSIVVVITVVAMLVILAGADLILSQFFEQIVF